MTRRGNRLRTIRFEEPERIPIACHLSAACRRHYDQNALQALMGAPERSAGCRF